MKIEFSTDLEQLKNAAYGTIVLFETEKGYVVGEKRKSRLGMDILVPKIGNEVFFYEDVIRFAILELAAIREENFNAADLKVGDKILLFDIQGDITPIHNPEHIIFENEIIETVTITEINNKNEFENIVKYNGKHEKSPNSFYACLNSKFGVTYVVKVT